MRRHYSSILDKLLCLAKWLSSNTWQEFRSLFPIQFDSKTYIVKMFYLHTRSMAQKQIIERNFGELSTDERRKEKKGKFRVIFVSSNLLQLKRKTEIPWGELMLWILFSYFSLLKEIFPCFVFLKNHNEKKSKLMKLHDKWIYSSHVQKDFLQECCTNCQRWIATMNKFPVRCFFFRL